MLSVLADNRFGSIKMTDNKVNMFLSNTSILKTSNPARRHAEDAADCLQEDSPPSLTEGGMRVDER